MCLCGEQMCNEIKDLDTIVNRSHLQQKYANKVDLNCHTHICMLIMCVA